MEHKEEQAKNSWDTFFHTGRVEDYLRYASCKVDGSLSMSVGDSTREYSGEVRTSGEGTESIGERPYAGYYSSNRDYIETEPYRGIR